MNTTLGIIMLALFGAATLALCAFGFMIVAYPPDHVREQVAHLSDIEIRAFGGLLVVGGCCILLQLFSRE
jgi:hypothetical protein